MIEIDAAIVSVLTADETIGAEVGDRVYRGQTPEGEPLPVVVFHKAAGTPRYTLPRLSRRELVYVVRAIDVGDDQTAAARIDAAVDAALTDQEAALNEELDGWRVIACRRESDVEYVENDEGVRYQHVGGAYRFTVVPAP